MKAYVFGGMLVLSAALAACSSSEGDTGTGGGSGGGTGEGGGGDGGSGSVTSGTNTGSTGTTTPATTTTTTSTSTGGGGECLGEPFLNDPTCDTCVQDSCCAEIEACIADAQAGGTDCVLEDGSFNPDGTTANAFFACADANCSAECGGGGGGICDTGLSFGDDAVDSCLGDNCCAEFQTCVGDDPQACIDCVNAGGGPLCDPALACGETNECFGAGGGGICDTGLSFGDDAIDACLGDNCCAEWQTCSADDPQACIDCVNAGGGPLCDSALACGETNGCFPEQ